jgi:hypothetical protein
MTLNEITTEIQNLSYDDLIKLNKSVIQVAKVKRTLKSAAASGTFSIGDRVSFNGKRGAEYGTITKVNRTRAIVDLEGRGKYSIGMGDLQKVQTPNA